MAYTKIHAIKATLPKAIKYITAPNKTDGQTLISTFACGAETAAFDFQYALSKTNESDPNKAFHLIQFFLPGEVSYGETHKVGAEHGLSIISPSGERGKTYKEWLASRQGCSWKATLKKQIDEAIKTAETYEDCIALIRAKGYEIKGESFEDNAPKYIAFRPLDGEHFVRGSAKSLGAEYTKERIKERIEEMAIARQKSHSAPDRPAAFPKRKKPVVQNNASRSLIETTAEKFAESPGFKHWADIQNLKIAAASYSAAGSISELEKQITAKSEVAKTARKIC